MKIALVSSHGGHLTEVLALKDVFKGHRTFFITYQGQTPAGLAPAYFLKKFHDNLFEVVAVWFRVVRIFWRERPDLVFSTGAEIAIPVFFVAKFLFGCKLAYLECSAQVKSRSLTGRIVYPICDLFLVQWEHLLVKYGKKARYCGGLI